MSQASSQIHDSNWVSLPIVKFSHNTSPYATRNFVWNHVGARNDLDFIVRDMRVIDDQGNYTNRVLMKITAGTEMLESQDLGELVKAVRGFDPSSGLENPLQIVIRSPFMAMRYPKNRNEVRRIQLKFHSPEDFTKAISIITNLGLPITDTPPKPAAGVQPNPSPATSMFSSASASSATTLGHSLPRPSSMQESSRPFGLRLMSPPISDHKIHSLPNPFSSEAPRSSSAQPYGTPAVVNMTVATPNAGLSSALATNSFKVVKPLLSFYEAQIEPMPTNRNLIYPFNQTLARDGEGQCSNHSLLHSQSRTSQQVVLDEVGSKARGLTASPFFLTQGASARLAQSVTGINSEYPYTRHCIPPQYDKPTGMFLTEQDIIHDILPPRRDLPFAKPGETSKPRSASTSGLPALPQPTPVRRANSTVMKAKVARETPIPVPNLVAKRVAQRKGPAKIVAQKEPESKTTLESVVDDMTPLNLASLEEHPSPLAAKSAAAIRPASATGLQSKASATKKRASLPGSRPTSVNKRPKVVDQGTQTQTISGRDHTIINQTAVLTEAVNTVPIETPTPGPPENYLNTLDAFVTKYKARPSPIELWEVPGYAGADIEARHHLLNNFICQNLENPDFLQLCQDTELAWRRIGLGA